MARTSAKSAIGVAALAFCVGTTVAFAAGGVGAYTGKVVNLREAPPPGLDATAMGDFVKENRVTGRAQSPPGEWTLNLFTVFKSKPGTTTVLLLLYDRAKPESIKKKEPIEVLELAVPAGVTLYTTTVNLTEGMGFEAEHKYLIRFAVVTTKSERILSEGEIALVKSAP